MKKKLALSLFLCFLLFQQAFAHKEWVHQYLVWESYNFMVLERGYGYQDLRDHIGFGVKGPGVDSDPWATGLVGIGAWREDLEDIVWGYGDGFQGWDPSSTHFWDGDSGDEDKMPIIFSADAFNSWQKARIYLFGGHKIFFKKRGIIQGTTIMAAGRFYSYTSLKDFYLTGNCVYEGYLDAVTQTFQNQYGHPVPGQMGPDRFKYIYGILGRVAHLLADNGCPAHTHEDTHPCSIFPDPDDYEMVMGGASYDDCDEPPTFFPAQAFTKYTARNQGSLIDITGLSDYDAMRKLFYTQNQLANFFPSDDKPGNNEFHNPIPFNNNYLLSRYAENGVTSPANVNVTQVAKESFNFSIRATATLFDWFARVTNQSQVSIPVIYGITYNLPDKNINLGETGVFTCYPYDPSYEYTWERVNCDENVICNGPVTGIEEYRTANQYKIKNTTYPGVYCNTYVSQCTGGHSDNSVPGTLEFFIKVIARNANGEATMYFSDDDKISPTVEHRYGGCPYVYVQNDSGQFISDNNILHKSEFTENVGLEISDKYLLNVKPGVFDNKISMNLFESTHDVSSINSIKLLAVDHPAGTKIGVTENNDIIMYFDEDVESPKNADRNHIENITQYVQYNNPRDNDTVSGIPTDDIYNNFDEEIIGGRIQSSRNKFDRLGRNLNRGTGDSVALIMRVGLNENVDRPPTWTPVAKRPAGNVTLTSDAASISTQFARRESPSLIIIPFGTNTSIEKADISWERDFSMSFAAVVDVFYSGFDVTELPLSVALNSANYDLLEDLLSVDGYYATLDTSGIIMLQFDNVENTSGMIRDYVLVTDGQYAAGTPGQRPASMPKGLTKNASDNVLGFTNKLNANFPNPFNPTTKINYQIKKDGFVSLKIYNIVGQLVKELVGEFKNAGNYIVEFNGSHLASGTYYYRIEANDFVETKKMILIK